MSFVRSSTNLKGYLVFILLLVCWGPSFLLLKFLMKQSSPVNIAFFRVCIGASVLVLLCKLQKIRLKKWLYLWKHFVAISILMSIIPFMMMNYSSQFISSGLVATLGATASFHVAILSHFFPTGEVLNIKKLGGILLGLFGVGFIYFSELLQPLNRATLPISVVLAGSFCFGLGTLYSRQFLHTTPRLVGPTIQLMISSIILAPFAALNFSIPEGKSLVIVLLLGIFSTGVAFCLYHELIRLKGATFASLILIAETLTAVLLGILFLNETLTWNILLGSFLICLGLWLANSSMKPVFKKLSNQSSEVQ